MKTITVTTVTTGTGTVSIDGTVESDDSKAIAGQVLSIVEAAQGNPTWNRTFRMTSTGFTVKRIGVGAVKIPLASLAKIAAAVEEELSFPPYQVVPPANVTVVSGAAGEIECSWASELAVNPNKWQYAEWNSGTSSYEAWADITSPSESDSTTDGVTTSTLSFTAGSGIYLDKTKFRKVIENSQGILNTDAATLTVTTP